MCSTVLETGPTPTVNEDGKHLNSVWGKTGSYLGWKSSDLKNYHLSFESCIGKNLPPPCGWWISGYSPAIVTIVGWSPHDTFPIPF